MGEPCVHVITTISVLEQSKNMVGTKLSTSPCLIFLSVYLPFRGNHDSLTIVPSNTCYENYRPKRSMQFLIACRETGNTWVLANKLVTDTAARDNVRKFARDRREKRRKHGKRSGNVLLGARFSRATFGVYRIVARRDAQSLSAKDITRTTSWSWLILMCRTYTYVWEAEQKGRREGESKSKKFIKGDALCMRDE